MLKKGDKVAQVYGGKSTTLGVGDEPAKFGVVHEVSGEGAKIHWQNGECDRWHITSDDRSLLQKLPDEAFVEALMGEAKRLTDRCKLLQEQRDARMPMTTHNRLVDELRAELKSRAVDVDETCAMALTIVNEDAMHGPTQLQALRERDEMQAAGRRLYDYLHHGLNSWIPMFAEEAGCDEEEQNEEIQSLTNLLFETGNVLGVK